MPKNFFMLFHENSWKGFFIALLNKHGERVMSSVAVPFQYLDEKKTANMAGCSVQKLQQDRFNRKGLPYVKLGRMVRYNLQDVVAYMESHKITHEAE